MTGRIVCDASAVIAALLDSAEPGRWAAARLAGNDLYAPAVLPYECANVIRRQQRAGTIGLDQAAQAHADLLSLPISYWPYHALAQRIWELRDNLSSYDAGYVALAEAIDAPLVTLDRRLARAPGLGCPIEYLE
ncbi:MAG TPA: type II toxin-antitoxin system VapC family toxin [Mycobacterium sp.]|nr:type II toxin-antitoxin system VapC family toxin [Mycobacterium sp.]